jgi:hypothetical protein
MSLWQRLLTFLSQSHASLSSMTSISATGDNNQPLEQNSPRTQETMFEIDQTILKMEQLAIQSALAGNGPLVQQTLSAMIELYLAGKIDIDFDEVTGHPMATVIDHTVPVVYTPMFSTNPQTFTEQQRKIGFKVD